MNSYLESARLLHELAHPIRLRLLEALCGDEECVCHLIALTGKRQAYISQQLADLRRAGLVEMRKEGLRVYYRMRDQRVSVLLKSLSIPHPDSQANSIARGCDCPKCIGRRTK